MITARHTDLARYIHENAIEFGTFTLASGATSSYYCDIRKVSLSGQGALLVADAVLGEVEDLAFDALGGMDMGATPITSAVALRAHQAGNDFPVFVVRKDVKSHGAQRKVEGNLPETPSRLVIVDDVVTSAGSIIKAIDVVRELGHEVVLALAILDREAGGAAALEAAGVPYRALVRISELDIE